MATLSATIEEALDDHGWPFLFGLITGAFHHSVSNTEMQTVLRRMIMWVHPSL